MMKMLMFILFLIPLINECFILSISMMSLCFIFMLFISLNFSSFISLWFSMDILSWGLVMLTCWIMFLMVLASYKTYMNNNNSSELSFNFIFMLFILVMVFLVNNLMLFYMAFEASLIPTLFLVFGWGYQPERMTSGYYLLFYTLFGSLPLLLSIFYIYFFCNTLVFNLIYLNCNLYMYISLVLAFLFKMPMLFFHFWLPKAHVEAPIPGSMILAGILLKLGGYGLMRFFSFFYKYLPPLNIYFMIISLFSCLMVGLICMVQVDIKSLIAYSSVGHMGMVIMGIMSLSMYGMLGSYILMLGHGLCSSALFCLANFLYERSHSRSIFINKGMILVIPIFSLFMFMASVNNMSSPPSLNLLGEIYIIISTMSWDMNSLLLLCLGCFMSCSYSIYMYSSINHGNLCRNFISLNMINFREYLLLLFHLIPLNMLILNINMFFYLM